MSTNVQPALKPSVGGDAETLLSVQSDYYERADPVAVEFFRHRLHDLVGEIIDGQNVETAIECMQVMDAERKRLDRVQANPPLRRKP